MSGSAKVTKISTLSDFKGVLAKICEDVGDALVSVELESRRVIDWLERDQLNYWRRTIKNTEQKLAQARTELNRRKLIRASGKKMDFTEQKEAVDLLQRKLEEAQEKLAATRRCARIVQRAVNEYLSQARQLASLVEGDPPASIALLERILCSLDAYLMLASAAVPAMEASAGVSAGSVSSEVAGGAAVAISTDQPSPEVQHSDSMIPAAAQHGDPLPNMVPVLQPLTPDPSIADEGGK